MLRALAQFPYLLHSAYLPPTDIKTPHVNTRNPFLSLNISLRHTQLFARLFLSRAERPFLFNSVSCIYSFSSIQCHKAEPVDIL